VRALALHADVLVFVSDVWQTSCTAVRAGDEGFVIDSPVYPEELRVLPGVLEQAGYPVSGLLTTHGDWDHLLGRLAFPGAALAAGETTVTRLGSELGQAHRELREFDEEHYVVERTPLSLGSLQALPVPGRLEIGDGPGAHELELYPTGGHTADGTAFWLQWCKVLVCGDYLSPVEIPAISPGGSVSEYRATLKRLSPLVAGAEWVVPGHGAPITGARAQEILAEDDRYLAELETDATGARLPASRGSTPPQRKLHDANVAAVLTG
jgi:glyoxylase-like metal-dependent hydrolase (beta-lactamase superfamily II)